MIIVPLNHANMAQPAIEPILGMSAFARKAALGLTALKVKKLRHATVLSFQVSENDSVKHDMIFYYTS